VTLNHPSTAPKKQRFTKRKAAELRIVPTIVVVVAFVLWKVFAVVKKE
jgi:hypothetical protein